VVWIALLSRMEASIFLVIILHQIYYIFEKIHICVTLQYWYQHPLGV